MMYESFAAVYDAFMDETPYQRWGEYLIRTLRAHGICDGLVLDLGCGTGTMTKLLCDAGYDMIGVDLSGDMLQIADARRGESDILYLQQDMRAFELYGTVRAVVSCCDALNYIIRPEELRQVFSLVNNYLDPGGLFLFDMNTIYKYERLLGDQTFAQVRDDSAYIWENTWYPGERINEYDLTLFLQDASGKPGAKLFRKFSELHVQRGYTREEITGLLEIAGLQFLSAEEAYTGNAPKEDSERLLFLAREKCKS